MPAWATIQIRPRTLSRMRTRTPFRAAFAALLLLLAGTAAAATVPHAFTAKYKVLRKGNPIGEVTLTLRAGADGNWTYVSHMKGTSGLAGLLGASVEENSLFRWRDDRPEAIRYDYHMSVAFKDRARHVRVNWTKGTVQATQGGKQFTYASRAGLIDKHIIPLALGYALDSGTHDMVLPVAVKDRVEMQHYAVTGKTSVTVPVGNYQADRVDRTDKDKNFSAWYVPGRFPVPVKLRQQGDDDLTMLLQSYSSG